MKDEALKLALEAHQAMREWIDAVPDDTVLPAMPGCDRDWLDTVKAALKQALAAPVQEPVAWIHVMDNTEGIKRNGKGIVSITQKRKHPFGKPGVDFSKSYPVTSTPLYTTPPAAAVQEGRDWSLLEATQESLREHITEIKRLKEAQPAVPDAMTSADIQEHIEYVAGWNDCRQAMLEMMK